MSANANQPSATGKQRPALTAGVSPALPMARLDCNEFGLLIPTRDLVSLLTPQQLMSRPDQAPESCGLLDFDGHWYPVFCLNKALQLQTVLEERHRVIALLRTQGYGFGLACFALTKLEDELREIYPVPPSMSSRKQPFTEFALVDDLALGLSSAAMLLALLQSRGVRIKPLQDSHASIRQGAG